MTLNQSQSPPGSYFELSDRLGSSQQSGRALRGAPLMSVTLEGSQSCLLAMSFVFRWLYTPGRGATIPNNCPVRIRKRKSWGALWATLGHLSNPLKSYGSNWPWGDCALCPDLIVLRQRVKEREMYGWSLESSDGPSEARWPILSRLSLSEETPVRTHLFSGWFIRLLGQWKPSPGCCCCLI